MTVYATRLVNGTDSRERMRRADAMGLFASGAGMARGGFRNDGGGVVTVNAGTMTVAVSPFTAWVDGGVSDTQGGYTFVSDTSETLTIAAGHASLSRTDVVIAEVRDTTHDASGSTDARVRILEGTPGSGVPALPTNALALRNITVPAGLSVGTGGLASGNLSTDRRTFTTGLGGVLSVASQAERDALPAIDGTVVYRSDTDTLEFAKASSWVELAEVDDAPLATATKVAGWGGTVRYEKRAGMVTVYVEVTKASWSIVESIVADGGIPVGFRPVTTLYATGANASADVSPRGFSVNANGGVKASQASTGSIYGSVTYPAA